MPATLKPLFLRLYRAGVLVVIAWLIHDQHRWLMAQGEASLDVSRVRDFFPTAASLSARDPDSGVQRVLDAAGATLGLVTQTAPESDKILGYSGPTNTLIGCNGWDRRAPPCVFPNRSRWRRSRRWCLTLRP